MYASFFRDYIEARFICVFHAIVGTDFKRSWAVISHDRGRSFHAIVGTYSRFVKSVPMIVKQVPTIVKW